MFVGVKIVRELLTQQGALFVAFALMLLLCEAVRCLCKLCKAFSLAKPVICKT